MHNHRLKCKQDQTFFSYMGIFMIQFSFQHLWSVPFKSNVTMFAWYWHLQTYIKRRRTDFVAMFPLRTVQGNFLTQSGLQYRYINPPLTYPCTAVYQVYHYSFYVINKSQWPPNYELNFTQMYQINELNDYIWMQVIDWRPNYTPNDFSGSIQ